MSAGHQTPASPKRRWFLKTALAVTAAAGAVGGGVWWHRGFDQGRLTPEGIAVFRAMARGILGGMLPTGAEREAILDQHVAAIEHLINTLPKAKRDQISLLAGALSNAPTRYLAVGRWSSWEDASDDDIRAVLLHLQASDNMVQNMVYAATRALTGLTFFSIPDQWSLAGYPGPMAL
jgi:TAT (twin-arginine translocation) pathway signal sequence